jgi:hypothetical protein
MVEQNKLTTDVTPDNWQEVLSQLQERPGFNNFVWLDCREVELSDLGPIAVTLEGGAHRSPAFLSSGARSRSLWTIPRRIALSTRLLI